MVVVGCGVVKEDEEEEEEEDRFNGETANNLVH
jgi:hypothetical protein